MTLCASSFHQKYAPWPRFANGKVPAPSPGENWTSVMLCDLRKNSSRMSLRVFSRRVLRVLRGFLAKCEQIESSVSLLNLILLKFRSQSARLSESGHCVRSPISSPQFAAQVAHGTRETKNNSLPSKGKTGQDHKWNHQPSVIAISRLPRNPLASSRGTPKLVASLLRLQRNSIDYHRLS